MHSDYWGAYAHWMQEPEAFWRAAAEDIDWFRKPEAIFDPTQGPYGRWFPDALCNTCYNLIDRHVASGRGAQAAILYDSAVTGLKRTITYAELLREVQACAIMLEDFGVGRGDRVLLYMPMVPEALIGMYACARIGAIHSVVFGGFAAPELAARIDDAAPKVILSASCGIEATRIVPYKPLLDTALTLSAHQPSACVILQRPQYEASFVAGRDYDWERLRTRALIALDNGRACDCAQLAATDPLYVLYTSGTTSRPKGVVRDNGGHMVALRWSMRAIYNMNPGEVFWSASDIGWVVGHSYIVYAPLLAGCTTVLYEGKPIGTPDAGAFWRVAEEYNVKVLFTAPTAMRAIRKEDPKASLTAGRDLSHFTALFLAGERADPDTVRWAETALGVPVIDHWWQTETGWAIAANPLGLGGLTVKPGSPTVSMPGYGVAVLDAAGDMMASGEMGNIVIKLPLPPGAGVTLWNAEDGFRDKYLARYPGFYDTADAGYLDEDGYLWVMGRTDDVINVAGHRLSTGGMEEVVASHPAVAECAVIGAKDDLKGELPCGFVVLKSGSTLSPQAVADEIIALVRERIGPVAAFKRVVTVERLPKTRSGKILRATIKRIADGETYTVPATIEDAGVLSEIEHALAPAVESVG